MGEPQAGQPANGWRKKQNRRDADMRKSSFNQGTWVGKHNLALYMALERSPEQGNRVAQCHVVPQRTGSVVADIHAGEPIGGQKMQWKCHAGSHSGRHCGAPTMYAAIHKALPAATTDRRQPATPGAEFGGQGWI